MNFLNWRNFSLKSRFIAFDGILRAPFDSQIVIRYRFNALPVSDQCSNGFAAITEDDLGIEWIPQDAIESYESALEGKISPVQEIHENNLLARGFLKKGDAESVYEQSLIKAQGTWETSYVEHAYIEPEAGYAVKRGQRLELFVSTQTPYMDRDEVAQVLGCLLYTSPSPRD